VTANPLVDENPRSTCPEIVPITILTKGGIVMAQNDIADLVETVRKIAKPGLVRFAKCNEDQCTESYLFSSDRFCGLRIRLGAFEAIWRLESTEIQINRAGHLLQTLAINDSGHQSQRAA